MRKVSKPIVVPAVEEKPPVKLLATADEAWRYPDYLRAGQQLPVWPSDRVIEIIPQMSDYLEEFR
jgi:hypothetical protein